MSVPRHIINNRKVRKALADHYGVDPKEVHIKRTAGINGILTVDSKGVMLWDEEDLYKLMDKLGV